MILIVDDKPENIFSLRRTLELNGFEVDDANSGEEALKKILKNTYSLIILDVQMPGMDGFEVADAISGYSKVQNIPIIFLSAVNTDKKFITKGYTTGGIDYVTKPVDPDVFILKVKTFHRLYEQTRELSRMQQTLLMEIDVRKKAEAELNNRMKELRSILESMPQIAFTATPEGKVEYVNEHWYLYSSNSTQFPFLHNDDKYVMDSWKRSLETGMPLMAEVRIKNLMTGLYRYHLLRVLPVKEDGTILKWVGTYTDIHEQKLANEILESKVKERTRELSEKNDELSESNHELQQFASVTSHDLKEPLRKIQIFSSIIREKFSKDNPDAMENMDRIIESSDRMSTLINDLLSYSRLSMKSMFAPTDLNEIVDGILFDLEFIISEKGAQVNVGRMPVIEAVPGQIRQVFQNLISNALKFSKQGESPVINIKAEPTYGQDEEGNEQEYCQIYVRDNGIGFNEKYTEKIFTIFQRLNPREAYEGTGIGLAIVKKIVEKHNGSIVVHSKEGQGAEFIITLPVHQVNTNEELHTTQHN